MTLKNQIDGNQHSGTVQSLTDESSFFLGIVLSLVLHFLLAVFVIFGVPYFVAAVIEIPPPIEVSLAINPSKPVANSSTQLDESAIATKSNAKKPEAHKSRKEFLKEFKSTLPDSAKKSEKVLKDFMKQFDETKPKLTSVQPKTKPQSTVATAAQPAPAAPAPPAETPTVQNDAPAAALKSTVTEVGKSLTLSQMDAVRLAVAPCWNVDAGMPDSGSFQVAIRITLNREGVVQTTEIVDKSRYKKDSYYRAAAEAASRALQNPRCRKLPLPLDRFNDWRVSIFTFDPRDN